LNILAWILVVIGAINWGLVGFFNFNLVDAIFGVGSIVSRIIYALVGLAGLWSIMLFSRIRGDRDRDRDK
jgi:uncharacterized membrane protein YuzA (DUF378 family)